LGGYSWLVQSSYLQDYILLREKGEKRRWKKAFLLKYNDRLGYNVKIKFNDKEAEGV